MRAITVIWIIKTIRKCQSKSHGQPHLTNEMANYQLVLRRIPNWRCLYPRTIGKAPRSVHERVLMLGLDTTALKWTKPLNRLTFLTILSQEKIVISACLCWVWWLLRERNPNVLRTWVGRIHWHFWVFQKFWLYEAQVSLLLRFWG